MLQLRPGFFAPRASVLRLCHKHKPRSDQLVPPSRDAKVGLQGFTPCALRNIRECPLRWLLNIVFHDPRFTAQGGVDISDVTFAYGI